MKKTKFSKALIKGFYQYILFFMLVAFLVTCTMTLFVATLSKDLQLTLTDENLNRAAKLTFLNVIILSVVFTAIDIIRRKLTNEKITRHIVDAAKEIVKGNFNVNISHVGKFVTDNNYNEIIDCFNKMASELSSLETLRTDFIANVSHEMKTPLAVMQNYGVLLQSRNLSESQRIKYAKGVTDCSKRMADMITNILKLSRLENQQIYPNISTFNLGEQLCEILLKYENIWEKENIEIETDITENIIIQADSELLSIVWSNLFSNAFKFTESCGMVSVELSADEKYATVKIKDTGCGMTADVGKRIFEKFYQGDTSHAAQGNGLGLALVKRVVDILKGEISVESTVNVGTVFTVKIPKKQ